MKRPFILSLLIYSCALRTAIAADGERRSFAMQDCGAIGVDQTDTTATFPTCLNAMITSGGGRMVIPVGIYRGQMIIRKSAKAIHVWNPLVPKLGAPRHAWGHSPHEKVGPGPGRKFHANPHVSGGIKTRFARHSG